MWNENSKFIREKSVHWQKVNDSIIILDPGRGKSHELNQTGLYLWTELENTKSFTELFTGVCEEYDITPEDAKKDLTDFFNEMHEQKLIVISS